MDRLIAAEVFVRIAELGNMSAAADALDMSRPMVTRYLAKMESWVGARLLHRTTRSLSLTPTGEQTLVRCRQMLDMASEMSAPSSDEPDTPRGLLRIACAQSIAERVLSSAVTDFLRRYPLTSVDLQIDSRPVNLVGDRIDLAIRITNHLDPSLISRQLGQCHSVVCASPAYLAAHGTPDRPEDLSRHNCLTYSYFGRSLWEFTDSRDSAFSVTVGGNLTANESQVLLAATVVGAGISLQPIYAAASLIAQGRLVGLLPGFTPQALGIHGAYSSRRHMPLVLRTMLDFLVERFDNPMHWAA